MSFYGYVRGTYFHKNNKVHISGLGDYSIDQVTRISDPVPIETVNKDQEKKKWRTLKDKEKIVYAPFSNLGSLNFDRSSGYITIPDKHIVYTKLTDEKNTVLN